MTFLPASDNINFLFVSCVILFDAPHDFPLEQMLSAGNYEAKALSGRGCIYLFNSTPAIRSRQDALAAPGCDPIGQTSRQDVLARFDSDLSEVWTACGLKSANSSNAGTAIIFPT